MKLEKAIIHNYRSIIHDSVHFQDYALLIGPNNSGKSTVIDAIRAFYEKDGFKFKKTNDFPLSGNEDDEAWVELQFSLTNDEWESLKEEYQNSEKELKVRKYFLTAEKLKGGKTANGVILAYKQDGTLSDESFYGAKNVQSGKFGDLIYIPAVSKIDDHTKLSGPSALRDLITNIMSDVVENSEPYSKFVQGLDEFANGIKDIKTEDNRSLTGFEKDLNSSFETWETNFRLTFNTPSTNEIIKSMMDWEIQDTNHDQAQSIDYFGSGFQRHFIYSLIQLGAKYLPVKTSKKTKDFIPKLNLLLFEEPEAFLHPTQQIELSKNLVEVSGLEDWQVICTTHSSNFVSSNSDRIPALARLVREDGVTSINQINEESWLDVVEANQALNKLAEKFKKLKKSLQKDDLKPEMESVKYFLWLNQDRASLFFANNVLLVEGPTETSFINKLAYDGILNLPPGTYILDCLGKYNIHRFMSLLGKLGIPHSVLHDDDRNNNNKEFHLELNKLIKESCVEGYTNKIVQVEDDIEKQLDLPDPGAPHRKPQHILYLYASNKIDKDRLKNFCTMVESCF